MSGPAHPLAVALAVALTATTAAAQPAQNLTLPYPADVQVVLHLNGVERTRDRLLKMLDDLPERERKRLHGAVRDGEAFLLKGGRKLTAVPPDGRAFLVLHDVAKIGDPEPPIAALLPVTGYAEFRESFLTAAERKTFERGEKGVDSVRTTAAGEEAVIYLVDLKGYVALTVDKATAEKYAGKYTRALSGAMGPALSGTFLAADVSVYVNMQRLNDAYGEQIRQFKSLIDFALNQAQMGGMIPGLNKKQIDLTRLMVNGVFQGVEDCQGLVFAAEFRPDGLNLRAQAKFAGETASTRILAGEKPGPLPDLARLPKGLMGYTGSQFGSKVIGMGRKLNQEFVPADEDEAGAARIDQLLGELAAAGPQGEYAASAGAESALSVTTYKDAAKAAAIVTKLYEALPRGARMNGIVLKDRPKVEAAARKHRDFTFARVSVRYDFDATVQDLPENFRDVMLSQLKRMAKESTTYWVGTDGKSVVRITSPDWAAAAKLLDAYLEGTNGIGSEAGFKLTRKNLPPEASFISLFETGETLALLAEYAREALKAVPGGLGQFGPLKPAKGEPTFLGIALTLRPELATVDLFVPGESIKVAGKMLAPLFQKSD